MPIVKFDNEFLKGIVGRSESRGLRRRREGLNLDFIMLGFLEIENKRSLRGVRSNRMVRG